MKYLLLITCLMFAFGGKAQIGIGTNSPNNSAALEIRDSTKGLLIPRMNLIRRNAIASPAEGLMIYQLDNTPGYYYFDGTSWRNVSGTSSSSNGGKQTIVLSDDITDFQAQTIILNDFGINTQELKIIGCTNLTSVDLSIFTTAIKIEIVNNDVLQTINLQNLTRCDGDLRIEKCPLLTNLNLSSLSKVMGDFTCYSTGITALNLPLLTKSGILTFGVSSVLTSISLPVLNSCKSLWCTQSNLSTLSCPSLIKADVLQIYSNSVLASVSLPALATIGNIVIDRNNAITSFSFPALTSLTSLDYGSYITNCPNLVSISFNNLSTFKNLTFYTNGNQLPSSQINYLLNKFVSINPSITGKSFVFTQTPPAPPTGQGISDKSTLISNGNNVTTN